MENEAGQQSSIYSKELMIELKTAVQKDGNQSCEYWKTWEEGEDSTGVTMTDTNDSDNFFFNVTI